MWISKEQLPQKLNLKYLPMKLYTYFKESTSFGIILDGRPELSWTEFEVTWSPEAMTAGVILASSVCACGCGRTILASAAWNFSAVDALENFVYGSIIRTTNRKAFKLCSRNIFLTKEILTRLWLDTRLRIKCQGWPWCCHIFIFSVGFEDWWNDTYNFLFHHNAWTIFQSWILKFLNQSKKC